MEKLLVNPNGSTIRRFQIFLLVLVLALAASLRIFNLSALGFWTDELCTLSCSHGWGLQFDKVPMQGIAPPRPVMTKLPAALPITQVVPGLVRDEAHPPLYFLMIRLWENLWGDSETAVRSLNVIFSLASIALFFFVASKSIGATAALWACLLMAVAEPQIQFSQEARNYMPVTTFSLLAIWSIQSLRSRPGYFSATILALAALAMMLTHYFAAGVLVGLAIYVFTAMRGRACGLAIAGFAAAGALYFALWGPGLISQWPHFKANYAWISDVGPGHLKRVAINFIRLPWRLIAELPKNSALQIACEIFGMTFMGFLPIAFFRRPELRIWILCFAGAIGIILAVDLIRGTAQLGLLRYSLFATPALYVLLSSAVQRGRSRFLLPATAVLSALICLPSAYIPSWKIDFRTPVQIVEHRLTPDDGLIIAGPDTVANGVMYSAFQHYLPAMPKTSAVLVAPPDRTTLTKLSECEHVWVIWSWPRKFDGFPQFQVNEEQQIPYFADLVFGRFASGNSSAR